MAKHRQVKNRRPSVRKEVIRKRRSPSPSLLLFGTTAVALSTALVFGHATDNTADSPQVQLAAATIGVGGRGDPTAANIPNKLNRHAVPSGFTYIPVQYPAGFDIDNSVAQGVPVLDSTIKQNSGQFLMVVSYSEGTLVAEDVRRNLDPSDPGAPPLNATNDPTKPGLLWVMIASPNVPNGGIFGRFPAGFGIPFVVTSNGPAQPSPYNTTYVTNEYDPYADFPAYFNPLSLANSLVAVQYVHPDPYYDSIDYNPLTGTGTTPVLVKTVTNSANGTDTYVFVPADHLPLLAPERQLFGAIGLTPLTEPVLGAVEPLLRLLVDMGYTDRQNLNPEQPVQFSLITPPARILETIAGVPGALGQGVTNFTTGIGSLPGAIPAPIAPTNSPSITAKSLTQQPPQSLTNTDPPPTAVKDSPPPTPSGSGTEPPVSTPPTSGPTLGKITDNGNKATPTPSTTTSPNKNLLTQLTDVVNGLVTPPKTPTSTTPTSDPTSSTTSGSSTTGQSQGQTGNAA